MADPQIIFDLMRDGQQLSLGIPRTPSEIREQFGKHANSMYLMLTDQITWSENEAVMIDEIHSLLNPPQTENVPAPAREGIVGRIIKRVLPEPTLPSYSRR